MNTSKRTRGAAWLALIAGSLITAPAVAATGNQDTITLKTRTLVIDPAASLELPASAKRRTRVVLLQFETLPAPPLLATYGIEALNYVADRTILARVARGFDHRTMPDLRWIGQLGANDKVSPALTRGYDLLGPSAEITVVVEAARGTAGDRIDALIRTVGGQPATHPAMPDHMRLATVSRDRLQRLAADEDVIWLFRASEQLLNGEPAYYCPGAMTPYGPVPNFVAFDEGWDGAGQGGAHLTYHFVNGTPDINGTAEEIAVEQALAEWARFADLTFTETDTANRNRSLDILFGAGDHGDGFPFDGGGNVLAHAFFPTVGETIAGDMHFDEAETWSLPGDTHMYTVALHEAGHSLGLDHSDVAGAVMGAFYGGPVNGLHTDDINGIRSLYADEDDTVCAGRTSIGNTAWQDYFSNGIFVDIDTSHCDLDATPLYHATIGGDGYHWEVRGTTSIYSPTPNGFRVYIERQAGITPAQANGYDWHINWTATPNNIRRSDLCTGQTPPGNTPWAAYGRDLYVDVDTSGCDLQGEAKYFTSIGGTGSQWVTRGASSIYVPTQNGFRIYIKFDSGTTPSEANARQWHINWMAVPDRTIKDDYCVDSTEPGNTDWINYTTNSVYVDLDTSSCGSFDRPIPLTSIGGDGWHWTTLGATSVYSLTTNGFRTYVQEPGGSVDPYLANVRRWHMNWLRTDVTPVPPPPTPRIDLYRCEGFSGQFVCDAFHSGGTGSRTSSWREISEANIGTVIDSAGVSSAGGTCTIGRLATVEVTITDSAGRSDTERTSFNCYGMGNDNGPVMRR